MWPDSRTGRQQTLTPGELPDADLVIVDEAHHAPRTPMLVLAKYPRAVVLGADGDTGVGSDGRGLGNIFDVLIECPQVGLELIEGKYLVPSVVHAPTTPDSRVPDPGRVTMWNPSCRADDGAELVGDIVTHWHRQRQRRKPWCS